MRVVRNPLTLCMLLTAFFMLPGCDDTRLRAVTTHYDLFFPEGSLQVDTFDQKTAAQIDILWVIDNSGTMWEEQNNLADNFDSFIDIVENSDVDYQIGVVSTDMDKADHSGKLLGNPKIILRGVNAKAQFAANVIVGTDGAGNEKGLEAAFKALTEPLISGANAGFLRPGSALAIIFVSDEDDKSFNMITFYQRVFEQMKSVGNENRVVAGAIVGDQPDGCESQSTGTAEAGTRYHMLVQAVGGSIGSICSDDFSTTLNQLGLTVAGLDRKFSLSDETPEESSITVKVNGVVIEKDFQEGWTFENGSIFFNGSYVPPPGATIEVSYLHPEREFVLSQKPLYDELNPGELITVTVYSPSATDCETVADCPQGVGCSPQAGKCSGEVIPADLANGWVLETKTIGTEEQYILAFQGLYFPEGGSTVQVVYRCDGGCI
ncbi:MAG: hypothetical protein JRJ19_10215 [Deltaproteobacteria bacterium]|nr:hypothetical protein [Deltaproteobacteria bacterium]